MDIFRGGKTEEKRSEVSSCSAARRSQMELSREGFGQLAVPATKRSSGTVAIYSLFPSAAILESGSDLSEEDGEEDALLQEADETKEKLAEFEQASEALLAELNSLEAEYEIEKRCREQAEAYAAQMNKENKKLKRISAVLLPMLSHLPGDFASLGSEDEIPDEPAPDLVCQSLQQIKDLQARVSQLLREKKELAAQVKELQGCVQRLQVQLEEESSEKQSLQASMEHHQRALKRVRQASRLVTQEYGEVSRQLDLEQELRQQAEEFAHQVKGLEAQLAERPQPEELHKLQAALAVAAEKQVCLERQLLQAMERNTALGERDISELGGVNPKPDQSAPLHLETLNRSTDDCKAKAVEEMMARIRSGVVLRSTRGGPEASAKGSSAAAVSKRRSAVMELQGLLSTMKRPARRPSRRKGSQKHRDNQLEAILQRRRRIVDCPGQSQPQQQPPATEATGHGTLIHTGGATADVHSLPKMEFLGIPPPSTPRPTETSNTPPGDPCKPATQAPQHLEEKSPPSPARSQQRVADLQTRRRMPPSSGSEP
ncbi:shootin-1-like [Heteronotia binoei]|uniref:shootin-1-like n=1 Tax=Heteronotia binoei TaxID=13085 RepID=UPI00292ED2D8|nr:shootin-1-like [Heteronotia binoei]